jgi:hypothetical protein
MTEIEVTFINSPPPYEHQIFAKLKVISSLNFSFFSECIWR